MTWPALRRAPGFTLLEILVVLSILGFLVAMVLPSIGLLDDLERERMTRTRMDLIRTAILGPEGRFDAQGRPIIGGYVGDMRAWPDLWEARAEIKPNVVGVRWSEPSTLSGRHVGQGPDYLMDPALVFYRPSGNFTGKRWTWNLPFRKLSDNNATNQDHIGGLETENEGQPRGLWTRYVEDLPFDLSATHQAPGAVLDERWKGPYLNPPQEQKPADAQHWATSNDEYAALAPKWMGTYEAWEDGDYNPSTGELGELFDEKEAFRLLQTQGRLSDGWDRALRFFITADPDHPGSTIFWIVSEGADRDAVYPNKGGRAGHGHSSWSTNATNTMGRAYQPEHPKNQDNIVMKLFSRDWEGIFEAEDQAKTLDTEAILGRVRNALLGDSPSGPNTGYTGDLAAWPLLFHWDNAASQWTNSTIGQARGLWTDTPAQPAHNLNATRFGLGWRHAYLGAPHGTGADNVLRDAWNQPLLFFKDESLDTLLVLSRGADGKYDFGTTTPDKSAPDNFDQTVDTSAYNASLPLNQDNRHILLRGQDWRQGWFQVQSFTVLNAPVLAKARFFASLAPPVDGVDVLNATTLIDADGDGSPDDWAQGNATTLPAFSYVSNATTGTRYLVFWDDSDGNGDVDTGEQGRAFAFPVSAAPGSGYHDHVLLDAGTDFGPLP